MSRLTEVCGLRVAGALAPMGRTASGAADLVIEPGTVTNGRAGDLLDGVEANGYGVALGQVGDVTFVRFDGLADAALDLGAGTATIELTATSPQGMDQVLAAGPVLALALSLGGQGHPARQRGERGRACSRLRRSLRGRKDRPRGNGVAERGRAGS